MEQWSSPTSHHNGEIAGVRDPVSFNSALFMQVKVTVLSGQEISLLNM